VAARKANLAGPLELPAALFLFLAIYFRFEAAYIHSTSSTYRLELFRPGSRRPGVLDFQKRAELGNIAVPAGHRMTGMMPKSTYESHGLYYDQLFPTLPRSWRQARMRLVRKALPNLRSVCELGCGTGRTAIEFARQGARVYGVDLSASMLKTARKKIRKAGLNVRLIQADMRTFRLPEPVDLISSEWGVVNHLPHRSDLLKVTKTIARGLRPGGYLLFDVNHRAVFEDVWVDPDLKETSNIFWLQRVGWDHRRLKGWQKMTWFVRQRSGLWKRFDEAGEEVEWSLGEIRRTLRKAGFDQIRALDYMALVSKSRPPARVRGYKTLFFARKNPGTRQDENV
jgi:SAM-dependent methyltransferase